MRIACIDHFFHTEHQRTRGRNHDEDHRGENTDICEADSVLFHAVEHAGHTGKMLYLIIVVLISTKHLQEDDTSGSEQQVGADDNQDHCKEEQSQRRDRILRRDC